MIFLDQVMVRTGNDTPPLQKPGLIRPAANTNMATVRVLHVLSTFAENPERSFGVAELSGLLSMTKNLVFRALRTLADEGWLIQNQQTKRYELGYRVLELGRFEAADPDLRTICAPFMRELQALTGETVTLSIPVGFTAVVIDGLKGRGPVGDRVLPGRSIPLNAGPIARAIIAYLSDDEISAFIAVNTPLPRVTPTTIVDPEQLWEDIRLTRARGYAVGYGDNVPNASGIGFPVLDADGRPHGAISTGGLEEFISTERLIALLPALQSIVERLNQRTRLLHASGIINESLL